ncbi:autophagy-related protein 2 homolog B isoform X2 [Denticeps clupeoides]|uniref:autophagy-related protein 2 homolog B isoform X2 n=1 Tax=Denticeps clupeoides TaxID=299321 RepID=UPI0010A319AE|nr:autophagy-related protein 2 homolog B isoform X2 [Denticeps clupeoides]
MPWPFSESIKKRACRYLLHRYLGHFLQEKLSLEQLSLDLYQGTGSLSQVPLDKWSLNEICESVDAPFEVIEGFIQTISLTVPWASLLQDNCALEVKGLEMVFRLRPRMASGMDPMCWSSFMTSSMQLAKECLSQRLTDEQGESFQPLEGLEKFAETIETVLRRVKVTFMDTILRIEHIPANSKTGIALEIRINKMVYCDETAEEAPSIDVHQPTTFAHKNLALEGLAIFWDEFSEVSRPGLKSSPTQSESEPKLSPSWNPKIICEPHPQFTVPVSMTTPFEPVQVGSLRGEMKLSLVLKQNEAMPGAKLDVDGQIDSIIMLLSPRQVHLLLDMFGVFSGGQEWTGMAKDRKSRPMQQEDEYRLHMELHRCLKKDTTGTGTDQDLFESQTNRTVSSREDVFFSMAEMDMSHSLSSLPPLGEPPTMEMDLSLNSNYSTSLGESASGNAGAVWEEYLDMPKQRDKQSQDIPLLRRDAQCPHKLLRQTSHPSKTHCDESRPELVFRLSVTSLAISVLHIDPLPPPDSTLSPLAPMASEFFLTVASEQLSPNGFLNSRLVFDRACPHDHLRLVGEGLKVAYEHCQSSALRSLTTELSLSRMELLECLYSAENRSSTRQRGAQYTELLTFEGCVNGEKPVSCLHMRYKLTERRGPQGGQVRLSAMPRRAELQVELDRARAELDISIVDRLNSLLQPQKLVTTEMMASHMYTSYNKHISLHKAFAEVFLEDSRSPAHCQVSVSVSAPVLVLAIRFPIPDLRSDQERGPWFKKSLQKEVLHLELEDVELKTEFTAGSSSEQTKMELTFKELVGRFQDDPDHPAARFLRVAHDLEGDMATSDSGKFDWPRVVLKINPTAVHSILERVTAEEEEGTEGHSQEDEEEEEGAAHSLKDVCDFGKPEPSPFSSRRVMYENEEMVIPGDMVDMTEFQEKTMGNSRFILELSFPNLQLSLPNKAFYEKLHNRINNDLLLWEPTAPSPVETVENMPYGIGLSVASQLINTYSKESFSHFRSPGPEEEDSGSEEETLQYYSTADLGFRNRRKRKLKNQKKNSQSLFSVILTVNHGLVALQTQARQEDDTVLMNRHGEFWMEVKNGVLFSVTQYEGYEDQHYICFHTTNICLYHQGTVDGDVQSLEGKLPCRTHPHWLEPALYASETTPDRGTPSEPLGLEPHSMLSVAVKISSQSVERNVKEFLISVGIRGATLQHRVVPSSLGWYDQIVDFLKVSDEPVLGYTPPSSITTLHLHLWSCSLDYRPLYLPVRSLLTVETFSISSSVSLDHSSSTLRIILDEAALFLSDKSNAVSVNLARDYVQVVDMGTLELRITAVKPAADGQMTEPRFELRCSSDVIHIRTCSDSCAALMNLIQYIASYGDLLPPPGPELKCSSSSKQGPKPEANSKPASQAPLLPEAEQQILQDLMSEAMEEMDSQLCQCLQLNGTHEDLIQDLDPPRSDLFLFPDESGNLTQEPSPIFPTLHSPLISPPAALQHHDADDFCILETPGSRGSDRDEEPVVQKLTTDPILVKDNHFSEPLESGSSKRGPLHFPVPEVRYLVKEISVVWHLYGGKDFGSVGLTSSPARSRGCTPHSSPSQTPVRQARAGSRTGGGWGRNPDVLMEIQLSKVRFQHEVYPQTHPLEPGSVAEQPVSRQVFVVQDLEIRDRLASSMMNKFLYLYSSKEMPRKAHSNMLTVRALHMCPEAGHAPQECCLRVSLMPLRLNIDQDALFFMKDFFTSLTAEIELFSLPDQEALIVSMKKPPGPEVSCIFSKHGGGASQDPAPIISVPTQSRTSQNGLICSGKESSELDPGPTSFNDQPIFFREFRFTSEVPIRLDYHGKHVSMEQGTFAGIVIGLTQLNCSELKLRRLCYRQGLLGVDKLFSYAINEWLNDIKKNQLPGLLGGVGPIHSLVQLVQGFRDLVWLPIEQYRKDGRIVRGFQRGTASFGTSTAMAALELTNRMVRTIQAAAETAYDMVSPGPDERECKKIKRYSHYRLAHQPVDLREGVAKAYSVVKEGITDTALTIYDTATREHEQRGMTGAVGGVLRQLPPAVVKPLIVATEATSNVLGGMRNQIHPDARQEESQKWRLGEE